MKVPSPSEPPAPPPAADAPTPADAPKPPADPNAPARWPRWVAPIDAFVAFVVVVTAFLVASHVARGSDIWPHLAAGRALLNGGYSFGTDPFAYTTAGRTWVNHAWLFDVGAYLLYKADPTGAAVVAVKAAAFALAFALGFLIRRPGDPLWPYCLCAAVAVLAAAPHAGLRPLVASALLLAVTLVVLFRLEWRHGSWRNPLILAGVFWLWANLDAWFVLGPATVALVLLGEWLQGRVQRGTDPGEGGPTIPAQPLALALGLGVLACMLNPHHVRVWELPAEVRGWSDAVRADPYFDTVTLSPLWSQRYRESVAYGNNPNGLAYLVLLVGGGAVLAMAFARVRLSYLFLWLFFAILSLFQYRLILFFAVAAVPIAGGTLAALAGRVTLGPANRPATQLKLLAAGVGRILAVAAVGLMAFFAYPGWLHPRPGDPAYAARVGWAVEPDPGMARVAKLLESWRESGRLPADFRGLHLNPQLADHVAWFAPRERVFANTRYGLHADQLADLGRGRRALSFRGTDQDADPAVLDEIARKYDAAYLVYASLPIAQLALVELELRRPIEYTRPGGGFALWHVDGRSAVLGMLPASGLPPPAFAALAFDPVARAFDPAQEPLPEPLSAAPPPPRELEWLDEYLAAPRATPVEALDAVVYQDLATLSLRLQTAQRQAAGLGVAGLAGVAASIFTPPATAGDTETGLRLLAVRAARRAVAANPDVQEPYRALAGVTAEVVFQPGPVPDTLPGADARESQMVFVAAARQYLDRLPPPERTAPLTAAAAALVADRLADAYRQQRMLDFAREMSRRSAGYRKRQVAVMAADPKQGEEAIKQLDARLRALDAEFAPRNSDYDTRAKGTPQLTDRVQLAVQMGLPERAIEEYRQADPAALGPNRVGLAVFVAVLELHAGRPDRAYRDLETFDENLRAEVQAGRVNPAQARQWSQDYDSALRLYQQQIGAYSLLGQELESALPKSGQGLTDEDRRLVAAAVSSPETFQAVAGWRLPEAVIGGLARPLGAALAQAGVMPPHLVFWLQEADFFLARGRLLVLEGKIEDAKLRFRQATRPQGVEVPAFLQQRAAAEQYLRMIDYAERAAK